MKKIFLVLTILTLISFPVQNTPVKVLAANISVNSTLDANDINPGDGICETAAGNGVCTLRAAIDEANFNPNPDTINLPAGTFKITKPGQADNNNQTGDFDIKSSVSIIGAGRDQTIIDGDNLDRVFDINPSQLLNRFAFSLKNLSLTHGKVTSPNFDVGYFGGIAIRSAFSDIILDEVKVNQNQSNIQISTGVLHLYGSNLTITNSLFENNITDSSPILYDLNYFNALSSNISNTIFRDNIISNPSLANESSSVIYQYAKYGILDNVNIHNNTNASGVSFINPIQETIIRNSNIYNNDAGGRNGGGISFVGDGTAVVRIEKSNIYGNKACNGGGIYHLESAPSQSFESSLYVTDSYIHDNKANCDGGGIKTDGGHLQIDKSLLESNTAVGNGGGLAAQDNGDVLNTIPTGESKTARVEVYNTTFATNTAAISGGGISFIQSATGGASFAGNGTLELNNNTIAFNTSPNGAGISLSPLAANTFKIKNNIVSNNIGPNCQQLGSFSIADLAHSLNIASDSSCAGFSNTNTDPLLGSLGVNGSSNGLKVYSLNSNSPAIKFGDPASCRGTDQRGIPRLQTGKCDIGAFEYSGVSPQAIPVVTIPSVPTQPQVNTNTQGTQAPKLIRTGGF